MELLIEVVKLARIVASIYLTYRFCFGDKSKTETLWYGICACVLYANEI